MALQLDARWTLALLGSARALSDENPPQAIALARRALEVNPSFADAQIFLAAQAADANKHDDARAALDKAQAVNPSNLDAIGLRAALLYIEDKPQAFEGEAAKALAKFLTSEGAAPVIRKNGMEPA